MTERTWKRLWAARRADFWRHIVEELDRIWLPYALLLGAGIAVALLLVLADAVWRAL